MSQPQTRPRQISNQGQKPPPQGDKKQDDYVYFDRSTAGFSPEAVPKAKAAQLKLEHFYKLAVDAAVERNTRHVPFPIMLFTILPLLIELNWISDSALTGVWNWNASWQRIPPCQMRRSSGNCRRSGGRSRHSCDCAVPVLGWMISGQ